MHTARKRPKPHWHCWSAASACTTAAWPCSGSTTPLPWVPVYRTSTGATAARRRRPAATSRCRNCSCCARGPRRRLRKEPTMGNRLSAIATRTGDEGTTGLGDGSRVSKSDARVSAMGDVDELNSAVGMLIAFGLPAELQADAQLIDVQQDLLDLGGELSIPGYTLLKSERVAALDAWLALANAGLPRLQEFIRPGGTLVAAQAHVCRTVCRRAERSVVELAESQSVSNTVRQYLNRLYDLMFVMARVLNRTGGGAEHQWDRTRND